MDAKTDPVIPSYQQSPALEILLHNYPWDGDVRIKMNNRPPQIGSIHRSIVNQSSKFTGDPGGRESATQSTVHLNSLGGRENTKFDHLDKTKDLSASPAGKAEPRSGSCANGGSLREASLSAGKAKPSYPCGDSPRIPRLPRTYFPRTISLRAHKPPLSGNSSCGHRKLSAGSQSSYSLHIVRCRCFP
jgi:hypothetical protein